VNSTGRSAHVSMSDHPPVAVLMEVGASCNYLQEFNQTIKAGHSR
jgi:hypothetical protein